MDKLPVGQLPNLTQSNNDDEIMVITNSEYNQLKKEKISDFITDLTSTDENNAIVKGTDGKLFTKDFGNASNLTEGTLPVSVLPNIPKDKLPDIEITDLPASGVTADTYAYPSSVTVNAQGQVTAIEEGSPSGANANTDLSNLTDEGEKHFLNKTQITNCILEAPNGVATFSGSNITLKQGLKMLYSNGRNIDKTLKNGELTLDSDTILDLSAYSGQTFDFELMFGCNINDNYLSQNYQESDVVPTKFSGLNQIYLNTTENQMYFYVSSSSSWEKRTFIKLGKGKLENGVVTSFTPYQPVELLKRSDLDNIQHLSGEWIQAPLTLLERSKVTSTPQIFDLSDYLPDNQHQYEVYIDLTLGNPSTNGIQIYAQPVNGVGYLSIRELDTAHHATQGIMIIFPEEQKMQCATTSGEQNFVNLTILGYRKLGNSGG